MFSKTYICPTNIINTIYKQSLSSGNIFRTDRLLTKTNFYMNQLRQIDRKRCASARLFFVLMVAVRYPEEYSIRYVSAQDRTVRELSSTRTASFHRGHGCRNRAWNSDQRRGTLCYFRSRQRCLCVQYAGLPNCQDDGCRKQNSRRCVAQRKRQCSPRPW